jgi:exonuclease V gamma subunit
MKAVKPKPRSTHLSAKAETLLLELGEECQRVLKLLAQLEMPTLTESQRETVLGELSASVLHLHEHTRGLDSVIDCEH